MAAHTSGIEGHAVSLFGPFALVSDALKARSFGGDFNALLAWWRLHRDDPFDDAGDGAAPAQASARRQ